MMENLEIIGLILFFYFTTFVTHDIIAKCYDKEQFVEKEIKVQ
jgi:hypothetical protein